MLTHSPLDLARCWIVLPDIHEGPSKERLVIANQQVVAGHVVVALVGLVIRMNGAARAGFKAGDERDLPTGNRLRAAVRRFTKENRWRM